MSVAWATPGGVSGTSSFDAFGARGPGSVVAPVPLSTPPTGDVFLALSVQPGSFNPQTDPTCGRPFSWDAYIHSITIN